VFSSTNQPCAFAFNPITQANNAICQPFPFNQFVLFQPYFVFPR
jgi:hypothetical protein